MKLPSILLALTLIAPALAISDACIYGCLGVTTTCFAAGYMLAIPTPFALGIPAIATFRCMEYCHTNAIDVKVQRSVERSITDFRASWRLLQLNHKAKTLQGREKAILARKAKLAKEHRELKRDKERFLKEWPEMKMKW